MIILITGSRKGIGRYLAEYYLEKDHAVIGCSREESDLTHSNYFHYCLSVSDEIAVRSMFKEIKQKFGRLDVIINNAGIGSMNHSLLTPLNSVYNIMRTNFIGTFLICREGSKLMAENKFGRIINFGSIAESLYLEGEAIYTASKSAITSFTKVFAKEVAEFDITCNMICPNPVETDLISGVPNSKIYNIINRQIIKRHGKMEDLSNLTDFFIKPESNFITAQTIYLGGVCD